ncbi:hypothetical protein [Paenibacillus kribbensis]|uniref:hypothetical protein n=1 Tax=Paenibacillus kribbensis TaxID=172713 RepID=UPI00142E3A96|nr:hypothetical protein [Paenibacillus kribbensis]
MGYMEATRSIFRQDAEMQETIESIAFGSITRIEKATSLIKNEAGLVKAAQQMSKNP